ncbi:SusD/RagB family nutrient-binding outer membrane lipoprotein [Rhizosphaericola mali]|uniref:SusD/RagB family nutrient-binding outer membrane lipoprotein n=1 Tax=Rhizosphaericola mali TaxID=2545455 RepID=A0A5P2G3N6_9BACT|nr:SusD/RagB family nutrient-binding outer membrane lipoprotein [Rhizosphaericola mali]QES89817.1 SusD/RagB family nutrient-binding outer membrane lipoprotein [Rhizosphaericola mali]
MYINKYKYLIIGCFTLFFISCKKTIEKLQSNPNQGEEVTPSLLLGTILTDMSGTGSVGQLGGSGSWDNVQKYNQYFLGAYAYYGDNQYSWSNATFDSYTVLKNVNQMEKEALRTALGTVNVYEAIGKFVKAYYFYNQTSMNGDIPMKDALLGSDNLQPTYSAQKDVFQYVLNVLDSANTDFQTLITSNDVTLTGSVQDIYYAGDLSKWQQAVNAFKLRVLISLSKKSSDADLDVATQFSNIINNPAKYPLLSSSANDLEFTYVTTYNQYPLNMVNFGSTASRYAMAQTYVKSLTDLQDPRVYVNCEPAWGYMNNNNITDTLDFNAFVGESTGASIATIEQEASARTVSFINRNRYYNSYVGIPDKLVSYAEMCFNIAEAINRGWVSGDAETWYKEGITTSFASNDLNIADTSFKAYFLPSGSLTSIKAFPFTFKFDNYYNQSAVKYVAGTTGLNQILMQKYIAMFQNSAWEGYFNYRRTGIPAFRNGTGIGNNGTIPLRWGYPQVEQNQNATNWKAALTNQGFATDDINGKMWLIQ